MVLANFNSNTVKIPNSIYPIISFSLQNPYPKHSPGYSLSCMFNTPLYLCAWPFPYLECISNSAQPLLSHSHFIPSPWWSFPSLHWQYEMRLLPHRKPYRTSCASLIMRTVLCSVWSPHITSLHLSGSCTLLQDRKSFIIMCYCQNCKHNCSHVDNAQW